MAIGPVVAEVSKAFDQYWNSEHAHPVAALLAPAPAGALEKLRSDLAESARQRQTSIYIEALKNSALAESRTAKTTLFSFAMAKVVHDSPEKQDNTGAWRDDLLISQLAAIHSESDP